MLALAPERLLSLPRANKERIALVTSEKERRFARRYYFRLFPAEDTVQPDGSIIHARAKYAKHLEFFAAGRRYRERCFMAANRVGKTVAGGFELAAHLTGLYPDWWEGRRFDTPIRAWACGDSYETVREIVQQALLGYVTAAAGRKVMSGTGVIPGHLIGATTWRQGVPDTIDTVKVGHVSGKWSSLAFKSYDQRRKSFQGTAQHVIWLDEECPIDIYGECLIRTATTDGIVLLTFTPLEGLTETVLQFMPQEMRPETFDKG